MIRRQADLANNFFDLGADHIDRSSVRQLAKCLTFFILGHESKQLQTKHVSP